MLENVSSWRANTASSVFSGSNFHVAVTDASFVGNLIERLFGVSTLKLARFGALHVGKRHSYACKNYACRGCALPCLDPEPLGDAHFRN